MILKNSLPLSTIATYFLNLLFTNLNSLAELERIRNLVDK